MAKPKFKTYSSKTPFITKNMDTSTGHITSNDNKLLTENADDCPVTYYKYEYGYLVFVPEQDEGKAALDFGFSKEFVSLLEIARKNQCKYLQLDSDGITYEDLPTFDW